MQDDKNMIFIFPFAPTGKEKKCLFAMLWKGIIKICENGPYCLKENGLSQNPQWALCTTAVFPVKD